MQQQGLCRQRSGWLLAVGGWAENSSKLPLRLVSEGRGVMKNGKYKEGWGVAAFAASDALTALAVLERSQRQLHELR